MGFWKGLVDKVAKKTDELQEEAKKRAAKKKAGEMALETGKAAARSAVKNAGKTLDYAGKKLEEALFGPSGGDEGEAPSSVKKAAPDPFAKLKAEEASRKLASQKSAAGEREQARAKTEQDVDDELAALKKKIRGPL